MNCCLWTSGPVRSPVAPLWAACLRGCGSISGYAYVANSWSDTVSVIDTYTLQVTRTLKTGFEPNAVFVDQTRAVLPPIASATNFCN